MGFWDELDEVEVEIEEEEKNIYIENPEEGFALISKLLTFNRDKSKTVRNMLRFNNLVDNGMLELLGNIEFEHEIDVYNKLNLLKDKMLEQKKIKFLNNKSVIGLGGKFSAGKSKFINSIINDTILPEDQSPTTSIPTYISGGSEQLSAYTFNDMEVELDRYAVEALTHKFYKKYNLGFAHIIRNILIQTETHKYKNVVLLDTPGYTKSDTNIVESSSDEYTAKKHLKTVDSLIWLVDIENGVISRQDIEFMKKLNVKKPILIVFNKADKVMDETRRKIVEKSRITLNNTQLNIYDVVAYSSLENKEYESDSIKSFFNEANEIKNKNENMQVQMELVNSIYRQHFEKNNKTLFHEKHNIENIIYKLENIEQLDTIIRLYSKNNSYIRKNNYYRSKFERIDKDIQRAIKELLETK